MLRLLAVPGFSVFLLLFLTIRILPEGIRKLSLVMIAAMSIVIWLQSNIIIWEYGVLDGRDIDWTKANWRGFVDSSIWFICLFASIIYYRKIGRGIINLALALFILQFVSISYLCVENYSSINNKKENEDKDLVKLSSFSSKQNILHILVDGFQSDVFLDLISDEQLGSDYRKSFSGFKYYEETLGVFPFTRFSVPAILSGKLYRNQMPKDEFLDTTLSEKTIISVAYENGYEVDMAIGNPYFARKYANAKFTNFYEINSEDRISETMKLLDLSLFRSSLHFVKPYIYNNQKWLLKSLMLGESPIGDYVAHTVFLNRLISEMHIARDKPVYKYMHVMNTHNPMVTNEDCVYAGGKIPTNRTSLTNQSKCTLDTLVRFFDQMKKLRIYDDALIMVHADHGGHVANHREGLPILFANGSTAIFQVASLASPLLMFKLPNASSDFKISKIQASLADISDTISGIMNWNTDFGHSSLLTIDPNVDRERRFRFYAWQRDAWESDYTGRIQEFIIKGSHYEEKWELGPVYDPPE